MHNITLNSVGIHHGNLPRSLVTRSGVAYLIPRAYTETVLARIVLCSQNVRRGGGGGTGRITETALYEY